MKLLTAFKTCTICLTMLTITGCKDSTNSENENKAEDTITTHKNGFKDLNEQSSDQAEEASIMDTTSTAKEKNTDYSGTYTNLAFAEESNCECYCLEIEAGKSSEICLKPGELYMEADFRKVGNDIHVFYKGASVKSKQNDIPWNDLDTSTAVATFSKVSANQYKLDWKGFQIDGKTAVDYALLGKKTLEGTYKLK
ncbi:hypothetical protein [Christiangramia sp. OXR-203]|jgi:D-alanyl-D-alanine carboxypeptidase|uniref:hypothetical protein n=1 Tax=Christiangramia sp. OXR-203 TaxID=3100176 RepID=UPI002AC9E8C3|nr:hypothetical protein [Christiangramia sp. OXR-203]WPY99249.1 hypothetical protein T8I65_03310 [Christiangramia sp. OXR-203]